MKKKIKYFTVFFIVILSSFMLNFNTVPTKEELHLSTKLNLPTEKKPTNAIEFYPDTLTVQVNKKLDSLLKRINKIQDFHGSLLVAKNGKVLYNNHIGYSEFRQKKLVNDTSVFQLASVSKQFTAAAIMLLYERDQIKLTDSLNKFYPNFPYEGITIKNLLNHTSGLPKYFWVAEHLWKKQKAPTNSEMIALMEASKVQRFFKPGAKFNYSNTGYFVLASIVEKVSGISFGQFVEENIFKPLEMNDSFVYSFENDTVKKNQLIGYRLYRGWRHLKINATVNDAIVGDKNVYATSQDLYKWINGLNSGKLLSKESVELMYAKGKTNYGREIPYGFGFRIDTRDQNSIYHHGKWNGFSTALTQYPSDELVVIVLEHTSFQGISTLNKKVKKIVSENFSS